MVDIPYVLFCAELMTASEHAVTSRKEKEDTAAGDRSGDLAPMSSDALSKQLGNDYGESKRAAADPGKQRPPSGSPLIDTDDEGGGPPVDEEAAGVDDRWPLATFHVHGISVEY